MKRHKIHNFAAGLELLARARPTFYLKLLASAPSAPSAVKSLAVGCELSAVSSHEAHA